MPTRTRGSHVQRPLTKTQLGLGYEHAQNRERLINRHTDGKPCWWCNKPLFRNPERNYDRKSLHADHSKSRALYGNTRTVADRLLHDTCNKQRGDGTRDHLRPALQHADNTQEHPLGVLAMDWPE